MKYIKYVGVILLTIVVVGAMSCNPKDEENNVPPTKSFFSVQGATYHEGSMPDPQGSSSDRPEITSVQGTHYVVPGGVNTMSVVASDPQNDAKTLYVGVDGSDGYYSMALGSTKGDTILISLSFDTSIPTDSFVIIFAAADNNSNVSDHYIVIVHLAQVQRGKLEISLSWDLLNDIDLHVVQPDSEEIYYGHRQSTEGGYLDLDSNPGCSIDSVNNEHIIYPDSAVILSGEYIVRVDFYDQCDYSDSAVTHYAVTARYNGELISPTSGSNPYEGTFQPGTSDGGDAGSGVEVMRFNINGTKSLMAFEFPTDNVKNVKTKKPCHKCK